MELFTIIIIALGLAMDAFAVSIVTGGIYTQLKLRHTIRMALFFGAFQSIMPLIGSLASLTFKDCIQPFDHWVAFSLLAIIGLKMIYESFAIKKAEDKSDPANIIVVLTLAFATSIDALAVGVTLSLITHHIFRAVIIIGAVTFVLSYIGCCLGRKVKHFFENKIEIIGGIILIAIGSKILLEHIITGK